MQPEQVAAVVQRLPYMRLEKAKFLRDFLLHHRLRNCLELGFMHGVSSAYIGGTLDEIDGHLTTIDLATARDRDPNIEQILARLGLQHRVQVFYEEKSFNWRLMRLLESGAAESFDFCYLDGGHTLYATGLAFYLVTELVKPGGWLLFDDLYFSFSKSKLADTDWVKKMPDDERNTRQIERIFSLLVERHSSFGNFRRHGDWAFAQKLQPLRTPEEERRGMRDASVGLAIERAHVDPEFRELLLHSPPDALLKLTGFSLLKEEKLVFKEVARPVVPGQDVEASVILLGPPVWAQNVSRAALETRLQNRAPQPTVD